MQRPLLRIRRRVALYVAGAALAVVVLLFVLVYFVIFPTSSPKPFKLIPATANGAGASVGAESTAPSGHASVALIGSWSVAPGSRAGYRVREKLASLPAQSDAVGRTSQIAGGARFSESHGTVTIADASFRVAVDTLKSDRSLRDEKIHEIGLESSRYPNAKFALTKLVSFPASALVGNVEHVSVTGVLYIHGTSRVETLPVELALSGSTFEAAGSLTFPWSEFGMSAPSIGGFVNVTEHATMEFDLRLQRTP